MLADDDENIRTIAVNKILQGRIQNVQDEESNSAKIRMFILPTLHASATIYFKMASLDPSNFHEPPAIRGMSNEAVQQFAMCKLDLSHPCHNQAVERHVHLVAEAAATVEGLKRRDGMIRQKIKVSIAHAML